MNMRPVAYIKKKKKKVNAEVKGSSSNILQKIKDQEVGNSKFDNLRLEAAEMFSGKDM